MDGRGMEATLGQGSMLWGGVVFRQSPGLSVFYQELQAQLCAQPTLRLLLLFSFPYLFWSLTDPLQPNVRVR